MEGSGQRHGGASRPEAGAVVSLATAQNGISETLLRVVMAALAAMAMRSRRRQAELDAALWRSDIGADGVARRAAVAILRERGLIDGVVALHDGGVLLSVTSRGFAWLDSAAAGS